MPLDLFEKIEDRVESAGDHLAATANGDLRAEFSTTRACGESVFSLC